MSTMKSRIILILLFLLSSAARGQEIPEPEYTPPESLVSLSSSLDFGIALDMLSEYAIRFAGKPIYDPTKQDGSVNIEVTSMPWEKALQTILARRGLWYEKKEHFFQVVVPPDKEENTGFDNAFGEQVRYKPGSKEIKIETIFFEGDRKALSEMGIDWSTFYNGKIDVSGALTSSVTETGMAFGINIPRRLAKVDITALFKLFDSRNIGRVIAQPQVVVTSGNQGKIQVGQDFSIKSKDFAGNTMDRFISTGTILEVTPHVIEVAGKKPVILLKAHVERSQAYPDVVSTIIKKSEANSLVQLYDGEETLIAGLYSNEKTTLRKGVPILRDLPWYFLGLRYIFGYDRYEDTQKELIIIIKASIFPEVYARQAKGESEQARSTLQERLQNYRFDKPTDSWDHDLFDPEKSREPRPAADPVGESKASEVVPRDNGPANPASVERSGLEIRNGTVQNVKDNLLLINWEKGFDTTALVKQIVTIVRREGDRVKPVGMAEVLRAKSQQTVARRVASKGMADVPLRAGDQAVIRYTAFTSLGATQ